jgi:GIY-YIG catalytic domain
MAVHYIPIRQEYVDGFAAFAAEVASAIQNPPRKSPLRRSELTDVPAAPGIYAIYENEDLIYVGESGSLKERIGDLFRTKNHSFRRSLGAERFSHLPGFVRATTRQGFVAEIEAELTKLCEDCLSILIVPVNFGRKEIEEKFVDAGGKLRNKRGRRGR